MMPVYLLVALCVVCVWMPRAHAQERVELGWLDEPDEGRLDLLSEMGLSPDGSTVIATWEDGSVPGLQTLVSWNPRSGYEKMMHEGLHRLVMFNAMSPSGDRVYALAVTEELDTQSEMWIAGERVVITWDEDARQVIVSDTGADGIALVSRKHDESPIPESSVVRIERDGRAETILTFGEGESPAAVFAEGVCGELRREREPYFAAVWWDFEGTMHELPALEDGEDNVFYNAAHPVLNADGSYSFIGTRNAAGPGRRLVQFVRWDPDERPRLLFPESTTHEVYLRAVSSDGRVILGDARPFQNSEHESYDFVWTRETGVRPLREVLIDAGYDVPEFGHIGSNIISADGSTILGVHVHDGDQRWFVAKLPWAE